MDQEGTQSTPRADRVKGQGRHCRRRPGMGRTMAGIAPRLEMQAECDKRLVPNQSKNALEK